MRTPGPRHWAPPQKTGMEEGGRGIRAVPFSTISVVEMNRDYLSKLKNLIIGFSVLSRLKTSPKAHACHWSKCDHCL